MVAQARVARQAQHEVEPARTRCRRCNNRTVSGFRRLSALRIEIQWAVIAARSSPIHRGIRIQESAPR